MNTFDDVDVLGTITVPNALALDMQGSSTTLTETVTLDGGTLTAGPAGGVNQGLTISAGTSVFGFGAIVGNVTIPTDYSVYSGSIVLTVLGTVVASGGTLTIDTYFTNFPENTLTGGSYVAETNSTLEIGTLNILAVDAASITLVGPGAMIQTNSGSVINTMAVSLTTIDPSGSFTIAAGDNFDTTNVITDDGTIVVTGASTLSVGDLVNAGTLELLGASSFFDVAAAGTGLTNGGLLLLNSGTYIPSIDPLGTAGADSGAITGLATNNGTFELTNGATYATSAVLTNNGTIIVSDDSSLTIGGLINNGAVEVDSTSSFVNTAVTNDGTLTVNGGTYTALVNDGTVIVGSGTLQIHGAVTGTGSFVIDSGAELVLDSSDAQTVAFANAPDGNGGGELEIALRLAARLRHRPDHRDVHQRQFPRQRHRSFATAGRGGVGRHRRRHRRRARSHLGARPGRGAGLRTHQQHRLHHRRRDPAAAKQRFAAWPTERPYAHG